MQCKNMGRAVIEPFQTLKINPITWQDSWFINLTYLFIHSFKSHLESSYYVMDSELDARKNFLFSPKKQVLRLRFGFKLFLWEAISGSTWVRQERSKTEGTAADEVCIIE